MAKAKNAKVVRLFEGKPDTRTLVQPSVRSTILWTPNQLRSVTQVAESGHLQRLADLCDNLIGDDRIQELLETRTGNLLGAELSFDASIRTKTREPAKYAAELEEDFFDAFPEDECAQVLAWGRLIGYSFGELSEWRETDSGRVIPLLKFWHPKHFRYDWPTHTWMLILGAGNEQPITPGEGKWILYAPFGRYRPWAQGLWRGLSRFWLLKSFAINDWGLHSEKTSKHVITAAENSTSDQRKQVAADIFEMYSNSVISLPHGFDMKLIELSANTREIYNAQIEAANEAAAIAILGQNLTTKVEGGSYAAAQTHATVELKRTKSDKATFSTTLRSQAVSWWAEYNFGDRRQAPWPNWHVEPPEDRAQNAETLKTVADSLVVLKTAGFKLAPETIAERFGIDLLPLTDAERAKNKALDAPAPAPSPNQPPKSGKPKPGKPRPTAEQPAQPTLQAAKKGYLAGQLYADDVVDLAVEQGAEDLGPFIEQLQQAIEGAKDYDALRAAVLKLYKSEEPPADFAEVLEHAIVMTNLGGRFAVKEDT
jgi:phage gp29-like protein